MGGERPLSSKALRGSGWTWVSAKLFVSRALWAPGSRRVAKSGAFIGPAPRMSPPRPLPALLLGNGTHPIPRPLRPALSDIKAPLRAKDFEKVRSAPAPYRVPAPARASRKFRVSAASPLRSSCPKVSKDRLVTSRPAPGSRLRPKGGTEGREGRDLFEGRARWVPRACRTPRRQSPAPPRGRGFAPEAAGRRGGREPRAPCPRRVTRWRRASVCASPQAKRASCAATRTWRAASCSGAR